MGAASIPAEGIEEPQPPEPAEILSSIEETPKAEPELAERSRSARLLVSSLLIFGILLMGGGLFYHQSLEFNESHLTAWIIFFAGVLVTCLGGLALNRPKLLDWLDRRALSIQARTGLQARQAILMTLSLILAITATIAAGFSPHMKTPWLAVTAWLASIGLAVWACWKPSGTKLKINWKLALTVFLLVCVALVVRGVNTAEIPHVLSGDEASSGMSAVDFIDGDMDNIFSVGWFSFPSFFFFIQSLPIRLLGQTTPALRLLSALAGALTVGAVYLVARSMFGELIGLAAAIFMAAFHYHINFSRIGLNNIWDGFWFVVVLGLFWKGWRSEKRLFFVLGGLSLGLSQYFYVSSRLIPFILLAWLFFSSLFDFGRLKRLWLDFLLAGFITLIVFLPLGVFFLNHPEEFSAPINRVTIFGEWMRETMEISGKTSWQILGEQIVAGVQGFTHLPLRFWYEPETPLLRTFSATAFLLGLILLAMKPKDDRFLLLAIWVAAFILTISFSESTPAAQRFVGVTPAVAILVAYGVIEVFHLFGRLWPSLAKPLGYAGLFVILLLSLDDARFYFLDYAPKSQFGGDHTLIAQDMADYLQTKSSDWKVAFVGYPHMGYFSIMSLPYLAPHIEGIDINYPLEKGKVPDFSPGRWIIVFLTSHEQDLNAVREAYPDGRLRTIQRRYPGKGVLYWSYELDLK